MIKKWFVPGLRRIRKLSQFRSWEASVNVPYRALSGAVQSCSFLSSSFKEKPGFDIVTLAYGLNDPSFLFAQRR